MLSEVEACSVAWEPAATRAGGCDERDATEGLRRRGHTVCVDGLSRQNVFENLQCFNSPRKSERAVRVSSAASLSTPVLTRAQSRHRAVPSCSASHRGAVHGRVDVQRGEPDALKVPVAAGLATDRESFEAVGALDDARSMPWGCGDVAK